MRLKTEIKNLIYFFMNSGSGKAGRASILMYHSVGGSGVLFSVKPEDFEWQMEYLKTNSFNVISLAKLFEIFSLKKELPAKTVVLTFDDGHEDNYHKVFPVLKKYNFPATIFLITGLVGDYYYSKSTKMKFKMMSWGQIKEMHNSGIDFEPHGIIHPKLAEIPFEEAKKEITDSKKIIEEKLGKKCEFFSYPFGNYSPEVLNITKEAGFKGAVTVKKGFVAFSDKPLELPRNFVYLNCGKSEFKGIAGLARDII